MNEFNDELRNTMLHCAASSIQYGLQHQKSIAIQLEDYPQALQHCRASFVTLQQHHQLRGCIGNLQATRPLIVDIAHNAYAAAFSDPRFPPLNRSEYPELELHISILSTAEPMEVNSETELLEQLQPGIDGLILEDGLYKATFLPSVWEQLPHVNDFVQQLKRKAGMDPLHWSETIQVSRYHTESFGSPIKKVS